jgi:L-arabinose transport system ATP-binding protein
MKRARYVEFDDIGKSFPGVRALDAVSFGADEGSVHGLVGENGAGKSTLLKALSGVHPPTDGCIRLAGREQHFGGAADAIHAGVAVIYQELHLVPEMSVAENLYLGQMPATCGVVKRRQMFDDAMARLQELGEDISPATKVGRLPIAQRQMIEIAKALSRGAKVIAFDEPTSSLSERESERLFEIIARLKADNKVIFYVSHRMEEIFRVCDAVTVLRDGRHVVTLDSLEDGDAGTLVKHMVGRDIADVYGYRSRAHGPPALEVKNLVGPGLSEAANFSAKQGEILGVFGLVGAGRSELMKLVYGATRKTSGSVSICEQETHISCPRDAIRAGLMFCPEDRKQEGIVPILSVSENLNMSARRHQSHLGFVINRAWEDRNAREHIERLSIRTPSARQLIVNLSGGNQQKVILARWLSENTRVMLLDEPTRGIDVGAKREIYDLMYDMAERGMGLVVVSSDLSEILGVSDRIMVMRQGRISGFLDREAATSENIMKLALPVAEYRDEVAEETVLEAI